MSLDTPQLYPKLFKGLFSKIEIILTETVTEI